MTGHLSLRVGLLATLLVVIVPFLLIGSSLEQWVITWLVHARSNVPLAALVIVLLLVADVLLPIPSSLVSISSGMVLGFVCGTAASTLGMTVACVAGYALGRWARSPARRMIREADAMTLERAFTRYGEWIVIVSRAVPVLAESSTMLAGMGRMPFGRFVLLTALANVGISAAYAFLGARSVAAHSMWFAFAGAVLVPIGPILWMRTMHRRV
jgi:uncharacterized membrane protein YdjX (TVP38/TMEM64 family)